MAAGDFITLLMRFLDIGADLISKFLSVAQNTIIIGILSFFTWKYGLSHFNKSLLYAAYAYLIFQILRTLFDLVGHVLLDKFEARILHEDPLLRRISERVLFPPFSRHTFNTYADARVQAIYVCREPVQKYWRSLESIVNYGLRLILGDAIEKCEEPLYHTNLLIVVESGNAMRFLKLDRSEVIDLSSSFTIGSTLEVRQVPLGRKSLTIRDMLRRLQRSVPFDNLVKYDIRENNCQAFVLDILRVNGLLKPSMRDFVSQDIHSLLKSLAPAAESASQIYAICARLFAHFFHIK